MVLPMDGDTVAGEPIDVTASPGNDAWAQFSPDGRWIAFESDRSGELQIYVMRFQEPGTEAPVTRQGGTQVRWSPRGDELFYIDLEERTLMAVEVTATPVLSASLPRSLFEIGSAAIDYDDEDFKAIMAEGLEKPESGPQH